MGCGKTTIAQELSKKLNLKYLDTDQEIEQLEKKKYSNTF